MKKFLLAAGLLALSVSSASADWWPGKYLGRPCPGPRVVVIQQATTRSSCASCQTYSPATPPKAAVIVQVQQVQTCPNGNCPAGKK